MNYKYDELTSIFMTITPEIAQDMLTHNENNRKLSKVQVNKVKKLIEEKGWVETNDSICFDKDGNLINGQHRLYAIIEMEITVPTFVKFGLDKESFGLMDVPKRRNAADTCRYKYPEIAYLADASGILDAFFGAKDHGGKVAGDFGTGRTLEERADCVKEYQGLAALAIHIKSRTKGPSDRSGFSVACIAGYVCGTMKLEDIDALIEVCKNMKDVKALKDINVLLEVCEKFKDKYNVDAAIECTKKLQKVRSAGSYRKTEEKAWEEAIYKFVNNVNSIRKKGELYPCTKETIKAADEKLRREML